MYSSVRLADVATSQLGKMLDKVKNRGTRRPYLRNPDVRWFEINSTNLQMMPFEDHELDRFSLKHGDVVVCEGGEAGRAGIWAGHESVMFQKALHRVRCGPQIYNRFLVHRLMFDYFNGALSKYYTGATIKHLTGRDLARYEFPLPPLDEQQRIAAMLDHVDDLRAKRRDALSHIEAFVHAKFSECFGEPVRNDRGWPIKTLGEIASRPLNNGIFRKNNEYSVNPDQGFPVVWVENLFDGHKIELTKARRLAASQEDFNRYGLRFGDVLFCRSSLKLDGIAYCNTYLGDEDRALFECHVIRLSPDLTVVSPSFLNWQLRVPSLRALAKAKSKTSTMTTIDQSSLCSIPVIVPPLELQKQFDRYLEMAQRISATGQQQLNKLDDLFTSLQHHAFTGDLEGMTLMASLLSV